MASPAAGTKRRKADEAAAAIKLDADEEKMTVEQYLKHQLELMEEKAAELRDDATDTLVATFKTHKEELRDEQQARKMAAAPAKKGS
jgi:hypothetical protein